MNFESEAMDKTFEEKRSTHSPEIQWSCHVIYADLGPTFMAAQQTGLEAQECQRNLSAIYIKKESK